jgi:protein involved in polysaccharide export with SLBB domain
VNYEGSHTLANKNMRLSDALAMAGGVTENAYLKGARLVRRLNDEERVRMRATLDAVRDILTDRGDSISWRKMDLENNYPVGIRLDEALKNPGSDADIILREGDQIYVPEYNGIVKISGDVMFPNTVFYESGKNYKYYVNQSGGFGNRAKKSKTFIVYQNGTIGLPSQGAKPEPGCEIVVPSKKRHSPLNLGNIATATSSLASLATLIIALTKL